MGDVLDVLRSLAEQAVAGTGLDVEDVELRKAGRRTLVRIAVDRDGGVTLDESAEVSRVLSRLLDDTSALGEQPYVLEVGSPGVSRPLRSPRHWARSTGRLVRVTPREGEPFLARIAEVSDDTVALQIDQQVQTWPFADIRKAVVQVEFEHSTEED